MTPRHVRALLFDLDGTLLDSFPAHFKAYEIMFARFDIKMTEDEFWRYYSPNWFQFYQTMGLPETVWEVANAYWLEEAARQEPELFPGVKDILLQLQERYVLGIVTSGSKDRVFRDLNRTGITDLFQVIVTADDVREPKPSPEGLKVALEQVGVQATETIYVGDTATDYEMARAASVAFIGVASEFSRSMPDNEYVQVNAIGDLVEVVKNLEWDKTDDRSGEQIGSFLNPL